jgi:hypothetical protein
MSSGQRYYGKFRGTVENNVDLGMKGRVTAMVTVGGTVMHVVAEACTPYPGFYAIPPVGAGVWIEFEEGNLNKPIWTGCWWKEGEVMAMLSPDLPPPDPATAPQTVVLSVASAGFPGAIPTARLKLNALTGTATLETVMPPATPALPTQINISPIGVKILHSVGGLQNTIEMTPIGIFLNGEALWVTIK